MRSPLSVAFTNSTILSKLNTFGNFDCTVPAQETVYYRVSTYSLSSRYGRIAAMIRSPPSTGIKMAMKSSTLTEDPPSASDFHDISSTNHGYIYTTLSTDRNDYVYIYIRNSRSIPLTFAMDVGTIEITGTSAQSYFSNSESDCLLVSNSGSCDISLTSGLEVTYMNLYSSTYDYSSSISVYIHDDNNVFQDTIYYYDSEGYSHTISSKMYTSEKPVYRLKTTTSVTANRIDAISFSTSHMQSSTYNGTSCFATSTSLSTCTYRTSKVCNNYKKPTISSKTVLGTLAVLCILYGIFNAVLLALNVVMACLYPNRLFRIGVTCACCFCCCTEQYAMSNTFYSSHSYSRPCLCFCGGFDSCECSDSGDNNNGLAIFLLFVLLIFLIFLSIILMYTLYLLCKAYDEEEKKWEDEKIRHKTDTTVIIINNNVAPPPQPMNQSLVPGAPMMAPPPQYGQPPMMAPPPQYGQPPMMAPQPMAAPAPMMAPQPMMAPPPQYGQPPMMAPPPGANMPPPQAPNVAPNNDVNPYMM